MRTVLLALFICTCASSAYAQFMTDDFREDEAGSTATPSICGAWGWLTGYDIHASELAAAVARYEEGAEPSYANELQADAMQWWKINPSKMQDQSLQIQCRSIIVSMHKILPKYKFSMRFYYGFDRYKQFDFSKTSNVMMNVGIDFGVLCTGASNPTVIIVWPKINAFIYVPVYEPIEIYDYLLKSDEVLISYIGEDKITNYKASVESKDFMYHIGFQYSIMSNDYEVRDWYIDRTTGGLGWFTPSNASTPDMQCKRLEPAELAARLNDIASAQFSSVEEKFDAELALYSGKKSKLKF